MCLLYELAPQVLFLITSDNSIEDIFYNQCRLSNILRENPHKQVFQGRVRKVH